MDEDSWLGSPARSVRTHGPGRHEPGPVLWPTGERSGIDPGPDAAIMPVQRWWVKGPLAAGLSLEIEGNSA